MSRKIVIPKSELETLTKWMSIEKIAERYKCHPVTVSALMKEYGINPNRQKERPEEVKKVAEVKEKRRPFCKTCKYRGSLGADSLSCCDYMYVTGHSRKSDPEFCDKYEEGKRQQTNNLLYARRKNEDKGDCEKT